MEIHIYVVDPASRARDLVVLWLIVLSASVLAMWAVFRLGRGAWGLVAFAGVLSPTIVTLMFGGSLPGPRWPVVDFLADVTLPLAVIGAPSELLGAGVGALLRLRWPRRR